MATVFKAYHAALDRYVAIKALHPAFKQDPSFLSRFEREARIVAKLDHPNIIPIYDFAEQDGTPYLVIRFVEGKTLKNVLREGLMPLERALAVLRPATDALAHAHSHGILHRDIKPSNIILANDGHVYLTDFGLARIAQVGDSTLSKDMLIGTPQYMSPEQAKGSPVDARSDIYSLGVVVFEMLTGRLPFNADTPYAVIHDHIYAPLPLPTTINPNLSPDLERVLLKALAKEPQERYAGAAEMMAALDQAVAFAKEMAPAPTPVLAPADGEQVPASVVPAEFTTAPPDDASTAPATLTSAIPPRKQPGRTNPLTCAAIALLVVVVVLICGGVALAQRDSIARLLKGPAAVATQQADAVRIARERVNSNPQDPLAHVQLGDALAKRKDFDTAYASYDRAIAVDPKTTSAYLHAGELAESADDLDRAMSYYKNGLAALPNNEQLLLAAGDVLARQKRWDEARAVYDSVLRQDPNSASAIWRLGDYYRAQGRPAEALHQYTEALVIDPDLPEGHFGLGMLALQRGANDEAKRQFQLVVNNPSAPPDLKDRAIRQLRLIK